MKRSLVLVTFLLLVLVLSVGVCNGAAVTPKWAVYDYTTTVQAPPGWEEGSNGYPMASYSTIKDGALALDSTKAPDVGPTYKLKIPTPGAGFKFTAVARVKVDTPSGIGMDFDFRTGLRERIILSSSGIDLNTSKVLVETVKTTEWHTYFLAYEIVDEAGTLKLLTKVYVDGATTPVAQTASTTKDSSGYFRFGDGSSSSGYAGSIDWILWTFDGAFSPDQVELPAGFSLK